MPALVQLASPDPVVPLIVTLLNVNVPLAELSTSIAEPVMPLPCTLAMLYVPVSVLNCTPLPPVALHDAGIESDRARAVVEHCEGERLVRGDVARVGDVRGAAVDEERRARGIRDVRGGVEGEHAVRAIDDIHAGRAGEVGRAEEVISPVGVVEIQRRAAGGGEGCRCRTGSVPGAVID